MSEFFPALTLLITTCILKLTEFDADFLIYSLNEATAGYGKVHKQKSKK